MTPEQITEPKHIINNNVSLLDYYFNKDLDLTTDKSKDEIFTLMTYSFFEDHYLFMRILLYIANTRETKKEEDFYKVLIQFICVMFPDVVIANIELFLRFGKKDDIIYFMYAKNITAKMLQYLKHIAKQDSDYNIILNDKLINLPITKVLHYKPEIGSPNKWIDFVIKLVDDPILNGITI